MPGWMAPREPGRAELWADRFGPVLRRVRLLARGVVVWRQLPGVRGAHRVVAEDRRRDVGDARVDHPPVSPWRDHRSDCTFIVLVTVIARFSLPAYAVIHHAILAGAGIVWFVGACWLTSGFETPASAGHGFSSRGRLRIVARWLQPAWTLYWLLTLIESVGSNAPATVLDLLGVGRLVSGLAAIGALMTIAIVLRRLAAWTRDDFAEAAFNWATFLLPIGPLLVPALTFPAFGVKVGIVAILLATLFSLPLGMVSLARSLFYAVGHSREAAARDENRRERAQRRNQQLHRRLDSVESPRRSQDEGRTR